MTGKMFSLYQQAADLNDPGAVVSLGDCYILGIGTEKDPEKAFAIYQKGADLKNPMAYFRLGQCYFERGGTLKDLKQAKEYIKLAHENGFPAAKAYWEKNELWKY